MNNVEYINIKMKAAKESAWNYPLQKGYFLSALAGMSVREFLNVVMQFDDEYIDDTVRTIFLNNGPVDDIDGIFIKDGDRMALGSAMPGLVGIVMGRDNPFKSFRTDISAHDDGKVDERTPITVTMKVFSTLAVETRVALLKKGIIMDCAELADFLKDKTDDIIEADGKDGVLFLAQLEKMSGTVLIRVEFA